jgi:hypothetical protein
MEVQPERVSSRRRPASAAVRPADRTGKGRGWAAGPDRVERNEVGEVARAGSAARGHWRTSCRAASRGMPRSRSSVSMRAPKPSAWMRRRTASAVLAQAPRLAVVKHARRPACSIHRRQGREEACADRVLGLRDHQVTASWSIERDFASGRAGRRRAGPSAATSCGCARAAWRASWSSRNMKRDDQR